MRAHPMIDREQVSPDSWLTIESNHPIRMLINGLVLDLIENQPYPRKVPKGPARQSPYPVLSVILMSTSDNTHLLRREMISPTPEGKHAPLLGQGFCESEFSLTG